MSELWYNDGELSDAQIRDIDLIKQVWGTPKRRTFSEIVPAYNLWMGKFMSGQTNAGQKNFQYKLMAIVGSSFSEVLWLDADNTAVRNPEYLFDLPEFRSNGALFWPE